MLKTGDLAADANSDQHERDAATYGFEDLATLSARDDGNARIRAFEAVLDDAVFGTVDIHHGTHIALKLYLTRIDTWHSDISAIFTLRTP
ncbi:hypothetical protein MMC20_006584 [Loxospora ochrophaea]|nr:hypothetical protein [Loxospora ochrophaea]